MKQFLISIILSLSLLFSIVIGFVFYYEIDIKNIISISTQNNSTNVNPENSSGNTIITNSKIDGHVLNKSNINGDINYYKNDISIYPAIEDDINISINYMRMFDATKVPLWMSYIESPNSNYVHMHINANEKISDIIKSNPQYLGTSIWHQFSYNGYMDLLNKYNIRESDVGFLFLVLQNNTKYTFYEIEFTYNDITNSDPTQARRENLKNLLQKEETKQAAILRAGESFIWLLNVYKTNRDGFPEYYLSDIQIPKAIKYRCNNKIFVQKIREPYREKAIRVALPAIWIYQDNMAGWSGQ